MVSCLDLDVVVTDLDLKKTAAILQSCLLAGRAKAAYTHVVCCKLLTFCMLLCVRSEESNNFLIHTRYTCT